MEETVEQVCRRVQATGLNPLERRLWGGAAAGTGEVQAAGGQGQAEPAEPLPTRARRDALLGGRGLEAAVRGHGGFSPASFSIGESWGMVVGVWLLNPPWFEFIWGSAGCTGGV